MKRATYIIYYEDKTGYADGYEVESFGRLKKALKWLHSKEIAATRIEIYKRGNNFSNDKDDVNEVHKSWWK